MNTILIVDHHLLPQHNIIDLLKREGFRAVTAAVGDNILLLAEQVVPDVVVLDIALPHADVFALCKSLREMSDVPIILLSETYDEADCILGLDMGADDYLAHPFEFDTFMARVKSVLRRFTFQQTAQSILESGNLTLDLSKRQVKMDGEVLALPPKEFELLAIFLSHRGILLSESLLREHLWDSPDKGSRKALENHIYGLRQKIEPDPSQPRRIITVIGMGYRFEG